MMPLNRKPSLNLLNYGIENISLANYLELKTIDRQTVGLVQEEADKELCMKRKNAHKT